MILRQAVPMTRLFVSLISGLALLRTLGAMTQADEATAFAAPPAVFESSRIVVESRGRGPDVILIPGLASTADVWSRAASRLDDNHRVHLVSIRGFGDVPARTNADGALIAPVAGEIERYIEQANLIRPALVGHSMGGLVALKIASDRRQEIGRVMVVDAAPFFPALISPTARSSDVEPVARIAYQALLFFGDEALRGQAAVAGGQLGEAADEMFRAMGWQGGNRATLAQGLYEVMTTDLRPILPRITAPVTVVYGRSRNPSSPRAASDAPFRTAYANLALPATYVPIDGAEHMIMIDQPTRFQAALDMFLR